MSKKKKKINNNKKNSLVIMCKYIKYTKIHCKFQINENILQIVLLLCLST